MIPVRNVYYMLSYAFGILHEQGYRRILAEPFANTAELCAAILSRGVELQLKRGLNREYIARADVLSTPRGKLDISGSIKTRSIARRQLCCMYDDFSVDSYLNRILKTAMLFLPRADISKARIKEIRKLLLYFADVSPLDIHTINWKLQYCRNNRTYQMLISICYLIVKGLLQSNTDGSTRVMDFLDEKRICRLYEKFILAYYRREHKTISATASQIPWQLDDDENSMLPVMQTDIMLTYGEKTLIIDAKYYEHSTQQQYGTTSLHSGNLYQIFTYVKNKEAQLQGSMHEVAGMLLYARTDDAHHPDHTYRMSGNKITVRTLDLNQDFSGIACQLDNIVHEYFALPMPSMRPPQDTGGMA